MKTHIIAMTILFISCNSRPSINFELINKSKNNITEIRISAGLNRNIKTIELINNKKIDYKLDMSDIPKQDGSYKIEFKRNGILESHKVGYYTNGYPLEKSINLDISDDGLTSVNKN